MRINLTHSFLGLMLAQGVYAAPDPVLQKVSKTVSLGRYKPKDLVEISALTVPGKTVSVSQRIVPDLERLIAAAKKDGLTLRVRSGYRGYDQQVKTFERWVAQERKKNPKLSKKEAESRANTYSARPGYSEHQLGTTIDLLSSENNYAFSDDARLKYVGWLERNAQRFNFKISFPKGGTEYVYEPWHLRWYPPDA